MGIYNCAATLPAAIDSILSQTYTNWELILCDDGSVDDTRKIAEAYQAQYPDKILLLRNDKNLGLNLTLNHCLSHATGDYVARQDGDDISLPDRLRLEVNFLETNPDFTIVSTPMIYFDKNGEWGRGSAIEFPSKLDFVAGTPFCHAPCMVRTEAIRAVQGYSTDPKTLRAEDYNLWFRMYAAGYRGCNLRTPLYMMRDDINAYKRRKFKFALNEAYVRLTGYRMLNLPLKAYIFTLRPVIVALLPQTAYMYLHHRKQNKKDVSQ